MEVSVSLLILTKKHAIEFIEDRIDLDADSIVVKSRNNGTYEGIAIFSPPPAGGLVLNADANKAKKAAREAINADAAKVEVTKQADHTYKVTST